MIGRSNFYPMRTILLKGLADCILDSKMILVVKWSLLSDPITFFISHSYSLGEITRAEVKVTNLLVQHNIPLAVTDHLSPLIKEIILFPDSKGLCMCSNKDHLHNNWLS